MEWDDTTASIYELQYQADDRQPDEHGDGAVYQCLTAFGNERSDFATVAAGQEAEIGGENWFVAQYYLDTVRYGVHAHRDGEYGGRHPEPVNDKYQIGRASCRERVSSPV